VIENQEKPLASMRTPLRARRALAPAYAHLPLLDADMVAVGHPVGYYRDAVRHDQPGDPYWAPTDFRPTLDDLGIPVTMIGGWYDMSLPDDGLIRLASASPQPQQVRVDLWPTAHQFRPGHRIRLQVSSGAHPRYARNTGSGEPLATATTLCTAKQGVYHDPAHPSAVLLPVVLPG
jgi:predicted acyl esterase